MRQLFAFLTVAISIGVLSAYATAAPDGPLTLTKSLPANFKDYGMQIVNKADGYPVRVGESSRRFEVRAGDCSWSSDWSDCKNDRERHELKSGGISGEKWIHWSIFLPEDFPIISPVKVALGQFHQKNGHVVWMFQNNDGGYQVDNQVIGKSMERKKILTDEEMRGKWNDILVHVKWTSDQDGFFRVYVNGETKPRYDWVGPTKSRGKTVYYKVGIYRSFVSRKVGPEPTQVVYYDDIKSSSVCTKAAARFNCSAIIANQATLATENDLQVCNGRLCVSQYTRSKNVLEERFSCWLNDARQKGLKNLPSENDILVFIGKIKGSKVFLSPFKLKRLGLGKGVMETHIDSIKRLVDYNTGPCSVGKL